MKPITRWLTLLVIMGLTAITAWFILRRLPEDGSVTSVVTAAGASSSTSGVEGYARALGPVPLNFPEDHGPHPDFQTEWWYFTGNLSTPDGRPFGYQLTIFRRALLPPSESGERNSDWSADQVYMAHFAITDLDGMQHRVAERLERGAAGLAGAQAGLEGTPFKVWLDDWQVSQTGINTFRLKAKANRQGEPGMALDLELTEDKEPVLQGDQGFSQKGSTPGQASYYYSLPRLMTKGTVEVDGRSYTVDGLSWMDHEFSTSALSQDQIGWDWFSLQLETEPDRAPYELMVFQIRRADGSIDPSASGSLIYPDGSTLKLGVGEFSITPEKTWKSPETQIEYPALWTIEVPKAGLKLQVIPRLADQELNVSYNYWEGAVQSSGNLGSQTVSGSGYVELTGYGESLGGEF